MRIFWEISGFKETSEPFYSVSPLKQVQDELMEISSRKGPKVLSKQIASCFKNQVSGLVKGLRGL